MCSCDWHCMWLLKFQNTGHAAHKLPLLFCETRQSLLLSPQLSILCVPSCCKWNQSNSLHLAPPCIWPGMTCRCCVAGVETVLREARAAQVIKLSLIKVSQMLGVLHGMQPLYTAHLCTGYCDPGIATCPLDWHDVCASPDDVFRGFLVGHVLFPSLM